MANQSSVPYFANSDQLYAAMKALLARVEQQDKDAANNLLASRMVICLKCTRPEAEVTLNARKRPLAITYGPSSQRPTLDIELEADTLHGILLGEISMKKALANGMLKVKGPAWKATGLVDLFHRGSSLYPGVLADLGPD
jgi:hypothetical protein